MGNIHRKHFAQLDNLLWDTSKQVVGAKEALELYERRWAYVEQDRLDARERKLIDDLTATVGNGFFMPAVA